MKVRRQCNSSRLLQVTGIVSVAVLALAACSGSNSNSNSQASAAGPAPSELSGNISLWMFTSGPGAEVIGSVVSDFEAANPGVTVTITPDQTDQQLTQGISSGGNIDVVLSGSTAAVGAFCGSGAFIDLGQYMARDQVDDSTFLPGRMASGSFDGTQCGLPMLADVFGLYYNTDTLAAAGYTDPPKTLSELETMALKMTTYADDGSIKTLGFNPLMGFYENSAASFSFATGATWMKDGKSAIADDPAWTELINWQKGFVDKIGYDKLQAFTAGLGNEFSGDMAFQSGQVAMITDGEWRNFFIETQTPDLTYGTAPFPTGDQNTDLYGGGYSMGSIVGISKTSKNPELAWALAKYLTTNTDAVVKFSNGMQNIPRTQEALISPNLTVSPAFKTFMDIAASPHVLTIPNTLIGDANQTAMDNFWQSYQAGTGGDLQAGLGQVDQDINSQISLSAG